MKFSENQLLFGELKASEEVVLFAPVLMFGILGPKVDNDDFVIVTDSRIIACHCKSSLSRTLALTKGFTLGKAVFSLGNPDRDPRYTLTPSKRYWEVPWKAVRGLTQHRFVFRFSWQLEAPDYGSPRLSFIDRGYGSKGFIELATERGIPINGGHPHDPVFKDYLESRTLPRKISDSAQLINVNPSHKCLERLCRFNRTDVLKDGVASLADVQRRNLIERILEEDSDDLFRLRNGYELRYRFQDQAGSELCSFSITTSDLSKETASAQI